MTSRKYLTYVGVGILAIGLLIGVVFGCGAFIHEVTKERPHFNSGEIVQRDYIAQHYDDYTTQQYAGETCSGSGSSRNCTPFYITVFHHEFVPDRWRIQIENCHVNHKDGSPWMTKQGTNKCFKKWVDVDGIVYNNKASRMGVMWNDA